MKKINPEVENNYIGFIDDILANRKVYLENTISRLQLIQSHYNYLPAQAIQYLAKKTRIEENTILGIATFYKQFRLTPAGTHTVKVCVGTACHVSGAEDIYAAFKSNLNISDEEDTDSEKNFSIVKAACLGCCMLAPVIQIDDRIYGYVSPDRTGEILEIFLKENAAKGRKNKGLYTPKVKSAQVLLCRCSSCMAAGANRIEQSINETISHHKLNMGVKSVSCTGFSYKAPYFEIHSENAEPVKIPNADSEQIESILLAYSGKNNVKHRLRYYYNRFFEKVLYPNSSILLQNNELYRDNEYIDNQKQIATEHAGLSDPLNIKEYKERDGLQALELCQKMKNPQSVIDIIRNSGLRGRGGGGFPSVEKWQRIRNAKADEKYLICNADEGDPGAFMDRMLLESFPFRVLEGIVIACLTLNVKTALIYVRAEYPLAAKRIKHAISIIEDEGLFSAENTNSNGINIEVVEGAGAFVCGEETALIKAIEGQRGIPTTRPPYPDEKGLWGKPTLVNNVETFSLIPWIIRSDKGAFNRLGTENSRGSKTFALAGKIKRSGLIEVPMGISIRKIVETIGGGMKDVSVFKAVQIGGPAGGCIPESLSDNLIDFDSLKSLGAIMGSGGLVVLDQHDCIVELARYFMEFAVDESCGRCTYCRVGCLRILELLEQLVSGKADSQTLTKLEDLAKLVQVRSKCGLGKGSVNPLLTGLKHFREEYEAHLHGKCPAGQCKELIHFKVNDGLCIGCTKCAQVCPSGAITPAPYENQFIDDSKCIKCGSCKKVCPEGAIDVY